MPPRRGHVVTVQCVTAPRTQVRTYVCMYVCIYVCTHTLYVRMYVCMYVGMYVGCLLSTFDDAEYLSCGSNVCRGGGQNRVQKQAGPLNRLGPPAMPQESGSPTPKHGRSWVEEGVGGLSS